MARSSDTEIVEALADLPGWHRAGDAIEKAFAFASFPDAVAFLVRLAFEAEAADHHPDVILTYRQVRLRYTTHSEGGPTPKDFEGARVVERLATGALTGRG